MSAFKTRSTKKHFITGAALTLTLGLITAACIVFTPPKTSHAASACPQDKHPETNIAYCGLDTTSVTNSINLLKKYYTNNSDADGQPSAFVHNGDFDTVANWGGASSSLISGM